MSKLESVLCVSVGIGLACCLTTWAGLRDRQTLAGKCEHFHALQQIQGLVIDCGSVTVSAEAWDTATDIVETVWQEHTNRLAKAQQVRERAQAAARRAAESHRAKGLERVRDIRRAAEEARKGRRQ